MGFKYLWISVPELQSWTTICCRRQEGPWNGCVSQVWFMIGCSLKASPFRAWVLFDFSGLCLLRERKKERKKKYRERDGIWEKMKERKKKNCSEIEIEETFTSEDQVLPWLKQDFLKQVLPWLKQVPLHNNFWKVMLSSRGYVVKKEPHNFLSFFRKGLHSTVITFFFFTLGCFFFLAKLSLWLLATNNYLNLMIK